MNRFGDRLKPDLVVVHNDGSVCGHAHALEHMFAVGRFGVGLEHTVRFDLPAQTND